MQRDLWRPHAFNPCGFGPAELVERVFKNTFAPGIGGDAIGVGMVIAGLRHGTIREADLPAEVHAAVADELERRERELISPERVIILLIGTMGTVQGRTLLQKYTFLVDVGIYSRKSRDIYTMLRSHEPTRNTRRRQNDLHIGALDEQQALPWRLSSAHDLRQHNTHGLHSIYWDLAF